MENCSHAREVEDTSSGTIVCMDCGLVLENQIFVHSETPGPEQLSNLMVREELMDLLCQLYMEDATSLIDLIMSRLEYYGKHGPEACRKHLQNLNPHLGHHRSFIGFVACQVFREQGRSIEYATMAYAMRIKIRDILQAEQKLGASTPFAPPSTHLNRLLACLDLPISVNKLVKRLWHHVDESLRSPEALLGGMLAYFGRQLKKRVRRRRLQDDDDDGEECYEYPSAGSMVLLGSLSVRALSDILVLSESAIQRASKDMPPELKESLDEAAQTWPKKPVTCNI